MKFRIQRGKLEWQAAFRPSTRVQRKPLVLFVATVVALCGAHSWAAEAAYYQEFLAVFGTNNWTHTDRGSASLVDPNNTALKIAGEEVDLREVLATGGVSGVRLGMTMDELVARWGKPLEIRFGTSQGWYCGTFSSAHFSYSKIRVDFEARTNAIKALSFDVRPVRLAQGLTARSGTNGFVAALGAPEEIRNAKGVFDFFLYRQSAWVVDLVFNLMDEREMFMVDLERLDGTPVAEPETGANLVDSLQRQWAGSVKRDQRGRIIQVALSGRWCTDRNLGIVAQFKELRELTLKGGNTTVQGLRLLRGNTNLSSVHFACFPVLPSGFLGEVADFPRITQLVLYGASATSSEYASLAGMTNLADLRVLYVRSFTDADFCRLTNLPSLQSLNVSCSDLTPASAASLNQFRTLTNAELSGRSGDSLWRTNWHSERPPRRPGRGGSDG